MVNPATLLIVGLVTGIGGAVTYSVFHYAEKEGVTMPMERLGRGQASNELLPMPPEEGPPLPRSLNVKWPWKRG